ncbi:MAG TPA: Lrp/AsnC family transcriptional regulator [Oceanospirillales bacterium]|nr:Lrp/AsnC family transcriptional regulator [Oceanospirillales bacterium]
MDSYDINILKTIQKEGRITNKELAKEVHLSAAPCWRRMQALEQKGYIKRYTALLNHEKLGLSITAFAHISLENHHAETVQAFDEAIANWQEVQECHATSGDSDYLLKIITKDMHTYNNFMYEKLLKLKAIRSVNTSFSMQQKKLSTELPLI